MWVQLPAGAEAPFSSVAEYDLGQGRSQIQRLDKQRTPESWPTLTNKCSNCDLRCAKYARLSAVYVVPLPWREYGAGWQFERGRRSPGAVIAGGVFGAGQPVCLLAILLRSYLQPLIIMSVIPFGLIGAVVGHAVLDTTISMVLSSAVFLPVSWSTTV